MVTTEAQEVVLPLPSVATTVTLLFPRLAQEKTLVVWLLMVSVTALQLSKPVANEVAETVTLPSELSCAVKGWQVIVGRMVSRTKIVVRQESILPLLSVTANTALRKPKLMQVYVSLGFPLMVRLAIPQASALPPSMSAGNTVATPLASRKAVSLRHTTVGRIVSTTVTFATQVFVSVLLSVTVMVTAKVPTSAQRSVSRLSVMV